MTVAVTTLREDLRFLRGFVELSTALRKYSKSGHQASERTLPKTVAAMYDMYAPGHLLASSGYFNLGYWDAGEESYDSAQEAMAELLASSASMSSGDTILDCGPGYGEQDFYWLRTRGPLQITGINVSKSQIQVADERCQRNHVSDQVKFEYASATDVPYPADSFDRVMALESAMHFQPRGKFFREAFRVLRPGGILALTDIVPVKGSPARSELKSPLLQFIKITVDERNWRDRDIYAEEIAAAGFAEVSVQSIRAKVWEPWQDFHIKVVNDPKLRSSHSRIYFQILKAMARNPDQFRREIANLDYILVTARKPPTATGNARPQP